MGEDQQIFDNEFHSLAGERFFSAIALMNAVPNSLPNRYIQVKNADIHDNLFVNCAALEFGTGNDFERTLPPVDVKFHDNRIYTSNVRTPYKALADMSGVDFTGNQLVNHDSSSPVPPTFEELKDGKGVSWYVADDRHKAADGRVIKVSSEDDLCGIVADAPYGCLLSLFIPSKEGSGRPAIRRFSRSFPVRPPRAA